MKKIKGGIFIKLTYPACFYACIEKPGAYTVEVKEIL